MSEVTVTPLKNGDLKIHVPMRIKTNRGRKQIILPEGVGGEAVDTPSPAQAALVQAVQRAYVWTKSIESGEMVPFTCGGIHAGSMLRVSRLILPIGRRSLHPK